MCMMACMMCRMDEREVRHCICMLGTVGEGIAHVWANHLPVGGQLR